MNAFLPHSLMIVEASGSVTENTKGSGLRSSEVH